MFTDNFMSEVNKYQKLAEKLKVHYAVDLPRILSSNPSLYGVLGMKKQFETSKKTIKEGQSYEFADINYYKTTYLIEALDILAKLLEADTHYIDNDGNLVNREDIINASNATNTQLREAMDNKTSGTEKPFSIILESEIEKAEIVLAVKAITDELQSMTEKLSKMQIEDVSAITERLKAEHGVQEGDQFQQEMTGFLQTAVQSLTATKGAIDNKALEISGDQQAAGMASTAPAEVPGGTEPGLNDKEDLINGAGKGEEDMFTGHEAAAGEEGEALGREKKESFQSAKKALVEGAQTLKRDQEEVKKEMARLKLQLKKTHKDNPLHAKITKGIERLEVTMKKNKEKLKDLSESARSLNESNFNRPMRFPKGTSPLQRFAAYKDMPPKENKALTNALKQIGDAFSPEMKALSSGVYNLAREAELVHAKRSTKTPDEVEELSRQVHSKIAEVKEKLAACDSSETGKCTSFTGLLKLLHIANNLLEKTKHAEIHGEVGNMIQRLEGKGMTESVLYKKLVALKEEARKVDLKKYSGWSEAKLKKHVEKLESKKDKSEADKKEISDAKFALRGWKFGMKPAVKESIIDESGVTRKHFRQVADLLKEIPDMKKRKELAKHHADIFKKQNPRFSHEKFYNAVGVSDGDGMNEAKKPAKKDEKKAKAADVKKK